MDLPIGIVFLLSLNVELYLTLVLLGEADIYKWVTSCSVKQISKSLLLDNYCSDTMFQRATSYLSLTNAVSSFSFVTQPCRMIYPVVLEKCNSALERSNYWPTSSKKIAETAKAGLRTVQRIVQSRKDSGEPSSLKCGRNKIFD